MPRVGGSQAVGQKMPDQAGIRLSSDTVLCCTHRISRGIFSPP
jgi:hypothetical protein